MQETRAILEPLKGLECLPGLLLGNINLKVTNGAVADSTCRPHCMHDEATEDCAVSIETFTRLI